VIAGRRVRLAKRGTGAPPFSLRRKGDLLVSLRNRRERRSSSRKGKHNVGNSTFARGTKGRYCYPLRRKKRGGGRMRSMKKKRPQPSGLADRPQWVVRRGKKKEKRNSHPVLKKRGEKEVKAATRFMQKTRLRSRRSKW